MPKALTEFHRDKGTRDGHASSCKVCACARSSAWVKSNRQRATASGNARRHAVRVEAAGRPRPEHCELCSAHVGAAGIMKWDHNHANGRFRGWICHSCNVALGHLRDNPVLFALAIDYLRLSGPGPLPFLEWRAQCVAPSTLCHVPGASDDDAWDELRV